MARSKLAREAEQAVNGPRAKAYGDAAKMLEGLAWMWGVILDTEVTPKQVSLCMIAVKILRENNCSKRDNWRDICGYVLVAEKAGLIPDED